VTSCGEVIARRGKISFHNPLLGQLDFQPIDEPHHPHAERGARSTVQMMLAPESIEHVQRSLNLGDGVC
jgi:hypothetical protein